LEEAERALTLAKDDIQRKKEIMNKNKKEIKKMKK
jgi:hypothetical protein